MKIKPNLHLRSIAGEKIVVVPPRDNGENSHVISLNTTASFIWENFQGKDFEIEDVVRLLLEKYEVDEEKAREDVEMWVSKMETAGAME